MSEHCAVRHQDYVVFLQGYVDDGKQQVENSIRAIGPGEDVIETPGSNVLFGLGPGLAHSLT